MLVYQRVYIYIYLSIYITTGTYEPIDIPHQPQAMNTILAQWNVKGGGTVGACEASVLGGAQPCGDYTILDR